MLRNWSISSEFDTLLMYINLHTKCQIFLKKMGIFCKKIITLSSSTHLKKKSTFLPRFQFFSTKLTFLNQNWYRQKHLPLWPQSLHDIILSLYICPKTDAFCIKCSFLLKENITKHWHFSKSEDISLRKLNISIKN